MTDSSDETKMPGKTSESGAKAKRRLRRCCLLLAVLATLGIAGLRWLFVHPYRRALPWSARVTSEDSWYEPGPLSQDFSYSLTATISEEEFPDYIQRLGLQPYDPSTSPKPEMLPSVHELLPCDESDQGWWKKPGAYDRVYGQYYGKSGWSFVRFSNGTVWAVAGNI